MTSKVIAHNVTHEQVIIIIIIVIIAVSSNLSYSWVRAPKCFRHAEVRCHNYVDFIITIIIIIIIILNIAIINIQLLHSVDYLKFVIVLISKYISW